MRVIFVLVVCALLQACAATVSSVGRPNSYYQETSAGLPAELDDSSIFGEDDKKISELLTHQVKLPKQSRIAILKIGSGNYWRHYSTEFNQLNEGMVASFINELRSSNRVYDASFLPAMLLTGKRSVTKLREAAARFQADLLLMYRSSCQSYQKYRFLDVDKNKSYCVVESLLLDVRSGIIVKSTVSSEEFAAQKTADDINFAETVKKAELMAITNALANVAKDTVAYINGVPQI